MKHSTEYRIVLNRMGYYNYQQGLIFRHINQSGGWDSHLRHCRSFILNAVERYKPERITVLGSGWLLELPLAELAEKTGMIILSDIVHPPEVYEQTRKFANVEVVEADATGGLIMNVWEKAGKHSFLNRLKTLEGIVIPEYQSEADPGMVISLNILTQLETQLISFLKKRSKVSEEEYTRFARTVQQNHLDFLGRHKSVLITDNTEVFTSVSGETREVPTLLVNLPPAEIREEWSWEFDRKGSDYYNKSSIMKVTAIAL